MATADERPRRPRAARRLRPYATGLGVPLLLAAVVTAGTPGLITVRSGDTLSELALEHGTSVAALRAANDLPGNRILVGQRLRLPGTAAPARPAAAARRHRVVRGDTLSGIAARYGVSQDAVARANRLPASLVVRLGDTLVIPAGGQAAPAARTPARAARSTTGRQPSREAVRRLVARTARQQGVDPSLALAVAYHESGFQQRVVSSVGAVGVMQVLPSTAASLSRQIGRPLDVRQVDQNVLAGVLVLKQLLRITDGDRRMALAGYYQGLGSIRRQGVLPVTRTYIRLVEANQRRFR